MVVDRGRPGRLLDEGIVRRQELWLLLLDEVQQLDSAAAALGVLPNCTGADERPDVGRSDGELGQWLACQLRHRSLDRRLLILVEHVTEAGEDHA